MIDHSRKKVLIVGLGLIGASLALAIKAGNDKAEIVGADNEEVLRIATTRGIIDQTTTDFESAAEKATHIILATPVDVTIDYIGRLAKLKLRKDVVITDTASTKQEVMAAANEAFSEKSRMTFIGGHPMAGSHKSGPNAADEKLFENAYYVLTKHHEGLEELLEGCHAKFIVMDADEHDAVTGQVSHLPHVLASALVLQSADYAKKHPRVENLAAGGFRDLTRIADSDADLWTSVMLSNTDDIVERIGNFQEQLDKIKTMLEEKDERAIKSFFENGKSERDQMEIHPGALEAYYDLFVSIPDESGSVLRVLSALESFSIVNIKINEGNREDIHGTLQISFKNEHDRERAREEVERRTKFDVVDK
ncbi:MAG: prephenate dehydrogenase [Streptococcaceae bacterium]|nr:prephenate dehydrogenase [Streptococcaceae bacterium]